MITCSSREGSHTPATRFLDLDACRAAGGAEVELEILDHLPREGAEVDGDGVELEAAALDARHIEELVGEPPQPLGAVLQPLETAVERLLRESVPRSPRLEQAVSTVSISEVMGVRSS